MYPVAEKFVLMFLGESINLVSTSHFLVIGLRDTCNQFSYKGLMNCHNFSKTKVNRPTCTCNLVIVFHHLTEGVG